MCISQAVSFLAVRFFFFLLRRFGFYVRCPTESPSTRHGLILVSLYGVPFLVSSQKPVLGFASSR
jgi:hypothetical protein